jgi:adenylate kinase
MRARGEEVRADDTPEVLSKRLASYRAQTEPLVHYYSEKRKLITVDGMMTIGNVTSAINRVLEALGASPAKPARKPKKTSAKAARKSAKKTKSKPKKASKAARKASKGSKKASRKSKKKARKAKSRKAKK